MNWRLILLISLAGVVMTTPSILGWFKAEWMEGIAWLIIAFVAALALATRGSGTFGAGFVAGALMGLWQHILPLACGRSSPRTTRRPSK